MTAIVRPFASTDQASLRRAINAVCAEGRWMSTPRFEPTPAWTHALKAPTCASHLLLIAENKGQVVGWCRLFPLTACNGAAHEAEMGIGLLREHRGRGLGKALLGRALDWAGQKGMRCVTLTTKTDNVRARRFFECFGFRKTGRKVGGWLEMTCCPLLSGG